MKYLKIVQKIFNPETTTIRSTYLKSMFFWNPLFSVVISLWMNGFENFFRYFVTSYLIAVVVSNTCSAAVTLARRIDIQIAKYKSLPYPKRKKGWHYSVALCAMPLGLFLAFKFVGWLAPIIGLTSTPPNIEDYRVGLLIGTLIAALFFFIQTRSEAREAVRMSELKLKNMENERLQAQIAALTAQMNPHLLFNALNTVASLIQTDPEKAEKTIIKLSELYRGVLDSSRKMTHPLATEINICEAYLAIEKARFGERLKSEIVINPHLDSFKVEVPALSLQPLIENAVKHGLASRASGGEITIEAKNDDGKLKIFIEDNGIGFRQSAIIKKQGAGTGIKNCQERLSLHYGDSGKFEVSERIGGGTIVFLEMPLSMTKVNQ